MALSENYDLFKIGKDIFNIAKKVVDNPEFRKTIEIGGERDIVAKADLEIEDAVIAYLRKETILVNLDSEERRRTTLTDNPQGLITLDPIDGTDNLVDNILHYCTITTIFDTPNPKTLGEAVWAGI